MTATGPEISAAELGRLFALGCGLLSAGVLKNEDYDVEELLARGWIARAPGRWSNGFTPAGPVENEYRNALAKLGAS